MNQIIKSYLGVFLILFMGACCFGIFGAFLQVIQAQNFHASVINEIEDSNYNAGVLRQCFQNAEALDYDLSVTLYTDGRASLQVDGIDQVPGTTDQYSNAKVVLHFPINVALFQIGENRTLCAYTS